MKKLVIILLLFILILQSEGIFLIYKICQYQAKLEMHDKMLNSNTEYSTLVLSLAEYEKSQVNKHEIYYNKIMYDVKSAKIVNEKIELTVIVDFKENNIIRRIAKSVSGNGQNQKQNPFRLYIHWCFAYINTEKNSQTICLNVKKKKYCTISEKIPVFSFDIPSPPPKQI